jgi:hypothetical protein
MGGMYSKRRPATANCECASKAGCGKKIAGVSPMRIPVWEKKAHRLFERSGDCGVAGSVSVKSDFMCPFRVWCVSRGLPHHECDPMEDTACIQRRRTPGVTNLLERCSYMCLPGA